MEVSTLEQGRVFCNLKIVSVEPILFDDLGEFHAQQENMTLQVLKDVIQDIYPRHFSAVRSLLRVGSLSLVGLD